MSDAMGTAPEPNGQQPHDPTLPSFPTPGQQGYGFPQQQQPPQQQPLPGYGYPPPQGGYGYPPLPGADEPDWYALAEQNESAGRRRKRLFLITGGILAAAAVAGIVTVTLLLNKKDNGPSTPSADGGTVSASPSPSGPKTPVDILSDAKLDKAPVNSAAFFPQDSVTINGRTYTRVVTSNTKLNHCEEAVTPDLGQMLVTNNCLHIHRATYSNGSGIGVTLAIADLPSDDKAELVRKAGAGSALAFNGTGQPPYCQNVTCATTQAALGRYVYLTIAGKSGNSPVAAGDTAVTQAARDLADYANATLLARGQAGLAAVQDGSAGQASPAGSPSASG